MAILVDQWIGKMYSETTGAYIGHPTEDHLARYLGFQDRQSLRESGEKPEFTCYIKKALSVISQYHITKACEPGKGHFPIGHIFVAKNMGWSDSMTVNNRNLNINVNSEVSDKQLTDIITGNAGDWL